MIILSGVLIVLGGVTALILIATAIWSALDTRRFRAANSTAGDPSGSVADSVGANSAVDCDASKIDFRLIPGAGAVPETSNPADMTRGGYRVVVYTATPPYAETIEALADAIETNPGDFDAHRNLGLAYGSNGNFPRSIECFGKAMELDPNRPSIYLDRGMAYASAEDYANAMADLNRAIELSPDPVAFHCRALTYSRRGQIDDAIADFDQAMQLNPEDIELYLDRGNALFLKGDFDQFVLNYKQAGSASAAMAQEHLFNPDAWLTPQSFDAEQSSTGNDLEMPVVVADSDYIGYALQQGFERRAKSMIREAIASRLNE